MAGSEVAAASILKQAIEFDNKKQFLEALTCYKEGIDILLRVLKDTKKDSTKYHQLRERIQEYMDRAEKLKIITEKEKKNMQNRKQIFIKENDVGYGYDNIFSSLLSEIVERIEIDDAYIRVNHQAADAKQTQKNAFEEIKRSLKSRNIEFVVEYSETLHDREIRLDNGWVVKIGRGLDYFKPVPKFALGFCDYNLRPCYETTIDIFHKDHII